MNRKLPEVGEVHEIQFCDVFDVALGIGAEVRLVTDGRNIAEVSDDSKAIAKFHF